MISQKLTCGILKQYEEFFTRKRNFKFTIDTIQRDLLLEAKQKGYGDRQIAHMLRCLESQVYTKREELKSIEF